jgi:pimeloyl-ACP methyl ester carboxylesterase
MSEPFYFGSPTEQLFGCYHEPPAWPGRECGLLLCYPLGQEYVRVHRAYYQLALQAALAGFPSMRFDYFGTGDSQGDDEDAQLERWQQDVRRAADELRARSGVERVVLAGVRLGGSLALSTALAPDTLAGLVLWEPVVSGRRHIAELHSRHNDTLQRFFVQPKDYDPQARPGELLGFTFRPAHLAAIEVLDLLALTPPQKPILLIEREHSAELAQLAAHLQTSTRLSHRQVPSFTVWVEDVDKGLVPQSVISAIIQWLEESF